MTTDLHTHSSRSDGTDSPRELVEKARAAGVTTLGLTDHDTTAGWDEAEAALPKGMRLVRGAEFSTYTSDGRGHRVSAHLLGYLFDPAHLAIVAEQDRLVAASRERVRKMLVHAAGEYPGKIDVEAEVHRLRADVAVGSHDVVSALIRAGVVKEEERTQTFEGPLRKGGPIHVPKASTPIEDAIAMIVEAGGVAVFAHPFARPKDGVVDSSVIRRLAEAGLGGIEVHHPDHRPEARATLTALAEEIGLFVTGSSDYHGTNKTLSIAQETTREDMLERLVGERRGVEVLTG